MIGFFITLLTFPGVIVHELGHQFFCRLLRVPVLKVCYFRIGNPAGYVIHEPPRSPWASLLIAIGPLFMNTIVGLVIAFPSVLGALKFDSGDALDIFLLWLGLSIAMHAFPSIGDARSIWKSVVAQKNSIFVKMVALPLIFLIYLGAAGSFFWLDAIYGICVVLFVPSTIVHLLASHG
jgi:hypothetical protein